MLTKISNFFRRLDRLERETFKYLLLAQSFNGLCLGVLILQEVILRKTLSGSSLQITILTMINPVANLFIIFMMDMFSRLHRRRMIFIMLGVFGKLILVLTLFAKSSLNFLTILIVYSILSVLLNPFFTRIMQTNIRPKNRGILYGITGSAGTLFSVIISIYAGYILDFNETYFKMLFAFAGIMGFLCCYFYSKINVNESQYERNSKKIDFFTPIKNALKILKNDRDFMLYEAFFFIYGIGFMIVLPSIPIFFVDKLNLDYSQISMAKGFIGQAGIILFLPLMGFFNDRINPMLFSSAAFILLSFYPLILFMTVFSANPVNLVYVAFAVFSVSMAAVTVLWDLSTIFFAKEKDSKDYQIVHIFLTGIRGLIIPFLGYLILKRFGVSAVFLTSAVFYIIASVSMLFFYFSYKRRKA